MAPNFDFQLHQPPGVHPPCWRDLLIPVVLEHPLATSAPWEGLEQHAESLVNCKVNSFRGVFRKMFVDNSRSLAGPAAGGILGVSSETDVKGVQITVGLSKQGVALITY